MSLYLDTFLEWDKLTKAAWRRVLLVVLVRCLEAVLPFAGASQPAESDVLTLLRRALAGDESTQEEWAGAAAKVLSEAHAVSYLGTPHSGEPEAFWVGWYQACFAVAVAATRETEAPLAARVAAQGAARQAAAASRVTYWTATKAAAASRAATAAKMSVYDELVHTLDHALRAEVERRSA